VFIGGSFELSFFNKNKRNKDLELRNKGCYFAPALEEKRFSRVVFKVKFRDYQKSKKRFWMGIKKDLSLQPI